MMPVPLVSVRNSVRKPISPRDGIRNSNPDAAAAVVDHVHHAAAARAELLGDDADEFLGAVHCQPLHGLEQLAVLFAGHYLGLADRELEALAAHHLDQDRELQFAAPATTQPTPPPTGLLDANRDVGQGFLHQPLTRLRLEVTCLPSRPECGESLIVKTIESVGSSISDRRQCDRCFGVGQGLADGDLVEPGDCDDVSGSGGLDLDSLQALDSRRAW